MTVFCTLVSLDKGQAAFKGRQPSSSDALLPMMLLDTEDDSHACPSCKHAGQLSQSPDALRPCAWHNGNAAHVRIWTVNRKVTAVLLQEFMKAIMCFMVEFWDVERQPQPPIKPHSEPYIDFEWPLQGWCIDLPQVITTALLITRAQLSLCTALLGAVAYNAMVGELASLVQTSRICLLQSDTADCMLDIDRYNAPCDH